MNQSAINELIATHQPGHALQQGFYRSAEVYEREMQRIFLKSWLYVGHHSQVPWQRFSSSLDNDVRGRVIKVLFKSSHEAKLGVPTESNKSSREFRGLTEEGC